MTAEIAVLNKTAVALATDSAVTISYGNSHQKVFDSADKLFELSCVAPIGIMIFNQMQFAGIPLPDLIKEFRSQNSEFSTVDKAAEAFLKFLVSIGRTAPESAKLAVINQVLAPLFEQIDDAINKKIRQQLQQGRDDNVDLDEFVSTTSLRIIAVADRAYKRSGEAEFYGGKSAFRLRKVELDHIESIVKDRFSYYHSDIQEAMIELAKAALASSRLSGSITGIVIAGFGKNERFPTLVSFEVEGVIGSRLKLNRTASCDIDRDGEQAFIQPFAQKEMVERFLYGLDEEIQKEISRFAGETVRSISNAILDRLSELDGDTLEELRKQTHAAEEAFLTNLRDKAFRSIESASRKQVEDMIQFMPKPELAKMAEALVDLTSIKRKVSVGLETVGGPVDVAVISKSEGFVWIRRKHYFPSELNSRYLSRLKESGQDNGAKDATGS